jgi:hypothetical protein
MLLEHVTAVERYAMFNAAFLTDVKQITFDPTFLPMIPCACLFYGPLSTFEGTDLF